MIIMKNSMALMYTFLKIKTNELEFITTINNYSSLTMDSILFLAQIDYS